MINKISHTLILVAICLAAFGQDTIKPTKNWRLFPAEKAELYISPIDSSGKELNYANMNGKVQVFQDNRLDLIEAELRDQPYIFGYTLQLEVSQQKSIIKDARYKILKISPNIELDDPYESPNIYLYAGRFYDRSSAYQYKNEISDHFPNAIVVGPKKMDLPVIKMPEVVLPANDSIQVDSLQIEGPRNN